MTAHDPMFASPLDHILVSSTALLYVNLIVAGVLLLEALLFYALLARGQVRGEYVLVWLALASLALALAYYMWSIYAQGSRAPRFPPEWFESFGGVPEPARLLTIALTVLAGCAALPLVMAVLLTYILTYIRHNVAIFRSHKEPS